MGKIVLEGLIAMSVALSPTIITITNIISTSFLFIDLGLLSLLKINASGIFFDAGILNLKLRGFIEAIVLVENNPQLIRRYHHTITHN
jgi:hypothetical protein